MRKWKINNDLWPYIADDEPDDGPQHYILLYGFLEAPLLVLLSDLGINVNCILRLTSEDYSLFDKRKAEKEEEEEEFQRPQEGKISCVY